MTFYLHNYFAEKDRLAFNQFFFNSNQKMALIHKIYDNNSNILLHKSLAAFWKRLIGSPYNNSRSIHYAEISKQTLNFY